MNVHTFLMIDRAYWERPGLSVAVASDLSREGENSRREEAKIFVIFMQEQVHTVAYTLQVNRFQTTVDLKVNNDSRFLCCSYGFRGTSGVLGSWYRLQYPIGSGQGPRLPWCWWSPLLLQWMGVVLGIAGVGELSKRSYSPSWAEF